MKRKVLHHLIRWFCIAGLIGGIIAGIVIHNEFSVPTHIIVLVLIFWCSIWGFFAIAGSDFIGKDN